MDRLWVFSLVIFLVIFRVESQNSDADEAPSPDAVTNFRPSLAVVIGILFVMFLLTFVLLIYAKFCHTAASAHGDPLNHPALVRSWSRYSGIDKTVIESLPFFRFSSLRGSKDGLECAVCLSKFEDIEILRLLPKCKHAFHINCVDQWLEKHSSCPLCRLKVNPDDLTTFTYSNSMRFLGNQSERGEDSNIELYVQREEKHRGSSRFSVGSSFRKVENGGDKEEEALIQEESGGEGNDQKVLHKHNHRIIASDVVFKNRWSNVSSSDLTFLNSEMLGTMSSNRFSDLEAAHEHFSTPKSGENEQLVKIKEEMERKRVFETKLSNITKSSQVSVSNSGLLSSSSDIEINSIRAAKSMDPTDRRVMSEITAVSRFGDLNIKNMIRGSSSSLETNVKEERKRQLWLPIARRTVRWFANREKRPLQSQQNTPEETLDV